MKATKSDWRALLKTLSETVGKPVHEIHAKDLFAGNSPFRQLTPEERSNLIFDGEIDVIKGYVDNTLRLAIPKSNLFLNRGRCPASDYFYRFAPTRIR
jgi:hypothetical protein